MSLYCTLQCLVCGKGSTNVNHYYYYVCLNLGVLCYEWESKRSLSLRKYDNRKRREIPMQRIQNQEYLEQVCYGVISKTTAAFCCVTVFNCSVWILSMSLASVAFPFFKLSSVLILLQSYFPPSTPLWCGWESLAWTCESSVFHMARSPTSDNLFLYLTTLLERIPILSVNSSKLLSWHE